MVPVSPLGFFFVLIVPFIMFGMFGRHRMWQTHHHDSLRSAEPTSPGGDIDEQEHEHRV